MKIFVRFNRIKKFSILFIHVEVLFIGFRYSIYRMSLFIDFCYSIYGMCLFIDFLLFYLQNFAVEMLFEDLHDVKENNIKEECMKAGGANYGTGQ